MTTIWDEFQRMHDQLDNLFENAIGTLGAGTLGTRDDAPLLAGPERRLAEYRQPLADIWEEGDAYKARLELPGVDKKDIDVNATEDGIEINVERKEEHNDEKNGRFERRYAGFRRAFRLPDINPDKVEARYENGVLELTMPRTAQKRNTKKITVR